jgi:hypothetical protein|tara:strand:- start:35 stop:214 length:180 start_codon:yes stop_codon:yes gene_type:complete
MVTKKTFHELQFLLEEYLTSENNLRKNIKAINDIIKKNKMVKITAEIEDIPDKIKDLED